MRIRQQVYWYWYSPQKMLFGIKRSLLKKARRKIRYYTENGYKKEICEILGSEWIRIQNIVHEDLLFFRLLHTCTSKVTNKE